MCCNNFSVLIIRSGTITDRHLFYTIAAHISKLGML